jgi:TolB protein
MPSGHEWRSILEEEDLPQLRAKFSRGIVLTSSSILLLILILIFWPILQYKVSPVNAEDSTQATQTETQKPIPTTTTTKTPLPEPTSTATAPPPETPISSTIQTATPTQESSPPPNEGMIVLAFNEAGYSHLFAYQQLGLPYIRLTSGPWDDITPALSPDGRWVAFASNRSGPWDLYMLDLHSGDLLRLTDTPQYDAAPSWSPDGNLLAYESYDQDLEILIRTVFDDQTLINLSEHPSADYHPAWSPQGRQLAFVSNRSGEPEVWLADFDNFDEGRFTNLSQSTDKQEAHPAWSPDGKALVWTALQGGTHSLYLWETDQTPRYIASGDWPIWSPDGFEILTTLDSPNQSLLTAYQSTDALLALPPIVLPGSSSGLTWGSQPLPKPLPQNMLQIAQETPAAPWFSTAGSKSDGQDSLVQLSNVQAPYAQIHDMADEAFQALRERVAKQAGWDFLATLENAFLPLTAPLPPGMGDDWLYTGRAFAFDTIPMNTGWVIVVPEKFGHQTYWRIYLQSRFQNGSLGKPMRDLPWIFNARNAGDPLLYEQGGDFTSDIPPGYWVDFTELAMAYGWDRLPALPTWQSAFFAARFNEFILSNEQTWEEAMLNLYPAEALLTPTPVYPPTLTPTRTPSWPIRSTPSP